jgi:hypothetical protein
MWSSWRAMQIVDLVKLGEDKSPLPPFKKGGQRPARPLAKPEAAGLKVPLF